VKQTISQEIEHIKTSKVLDLPLRLKALTALYFNRKHEHGDVGRIMLAIELLSTQLALRINDPDLGFDKLWSDFDSKYSSVRSVAKGAMHIGYIAAKLNITE
jgi:hypothetical protein